MSIQVNSNFNYKGSKPNFERDRFETLELMRSADERSLDNGHISYCEETGLHYVFKNTNADDYMLGKWREYSGSNSKILQVKNIITSETIGSTEIINYSLLTSDISELKADQLIYDTNGIVAKIHSIDITSGDVHIEIIHCNSGTAKIPEPTDDEKLYFRSRQTGNESGEWKLFTTVDGNEIQLTISKKDSSGDEGNYIPKAQEFVYDSDRKIIVLGDGKTTLRNLRAFYSVSIVENDVVSALGYNPESVLNKGQANGYAPLDANGLVPIGNLPRNLTDTYSKTEIDSKDSDTLTNVTGLINSEASIARNNENLIKSDLDTHIANNVIHVTQSDKDAWNNKVEQTDLIDINNHITDNIIHVTQSDKDKWDGMNQAFFVNNVKDLPTADNKIGYIGYVKTSPDGVTPIACETYIWDGTSWQKLDQNQISLDFKWGNIIDKPKSTVLSIDNSVKVAHNHNNKTILDKIEQSTTGNFMYDGVEIGVKAKFFNTEKDLDSNGEENTLYVVYSDSRVRGFPSISVWRDGAFQILGRGTQEAPVTVGDMNILQAEYFSVEANKSFVINLTSNQFFAFMPVEILKEIPGEKDQEKILVDFSNSSDFKYNNNLLDISKDLHLKISIKEIPTILDKVDDTYFSSVEIDLSEFKDIDLIQ